MKLCVLGIILILVFLMMPLGFGEWNDRIQIYGSVEMRDNVVDNDFFLQSDSEILVKEEITDNPEPSQEIQTGTIGDVDQERTHDGEEFNGVDKVEEEITDNPKPSQESLDDTISDDVDQEEVPDSVESNEEDNNSADSGSTLDQVDNAEINESENVSEDNQIDQSEDTNVDSEQEQIDASSIQDTNINDYTDQGVIITESTIGLD